MSWDLGQEANPKSARGAWKALAHSAMAHQISGSCFEKTSGSPALEDGKARRSPGGQLGRTPVSTATAPPSPARPVGCLFAGDGFTDLEPSSA